LRQLEGGLDRADGPPFVLQVHLQVLHALAVVAPEVGVALLLQRVLQRVRVAAAELVAELDQLVNDVHLKVVDNPGSFASQARSQSYGF
jgi:hypothetical protein